MPDTSAVTLLVVFVLAVLPLACATPGTTPAPAVTTASSDEALVEAARHGRIGAVRLLLDAGADPDARTAYGEFALGVAAAGGHADVVEELILRHADPRQAGGTGDTALLVAAAAGHQGLARRIAATLPALGAPELAALDDAEALALRLEREPDLVTREQWGESRRTLLHVAACAGAHRSCDLLVRLGADVNSMGDFGPPIYCAVSRGDRTLVDWLIAKGADISRRTGGEWDGHAIALARTLDDLEFVLDRGADPNSRGTYEDRTSLHDCVASADIDRCRILLGHGADGAARTSDGATAMHLVTMPEMVDLLVEAGLRVDAADQFGRTPLHQVVQLFHEETEQVMGTAARLMDRGASVSARDAQGRTALHRAQRTAIVAFLIDRGADPNARDREGRTPLHAVAATWGLRHATEPCRTLLARGADAQIEDDDGLTALDLAISGAAEGPRACLEEGSRPTP